MNIEKDAKHDNIEQSEYRMLGPLSFWTVGSLVFGIGLIYPFALQSEPFSVILGIYLLVMAMYDIPRRFARIRVNESGVTVRYMFWEEFFPYSRIARVSTLAGNGEDEVIYFGDRFVWGRDTFRTIDSGMQLMQQIRTRVSRFETGDSQGLLRHLSKDDCFRFAYPRHLVAGVQAIGLFLTVIAAEQLFTMFSDGMRQQQLTASALLGWLLIALLVLGLALLLKPKWLFPMYVLRNDQLVRHGRLRLRTRKIELASVFGTEWRSNWLGVALFVQQGKLFVQQRGTRFPISSGIEHRALLEPLLLKLESTLPNDAQIASMPVGSDGSIVLHCTTRDNVLTCALVILIPLIFLMSDYFASLAWPRGIQVLLWLLVPVAQYIAISRLLRRKFVFAPDRIVAHAIFRDASYDVARIKRVEFVAGLDDLSIRFKPVRSADSTLEYLWEVLSGRNDLRIDCQRFEVSPQELRARLVQFYRLDERHGNLDSSLSPSRPGMREV